MKSKKNLGCIGWIVLLLLLYLFLAVAVIGGIIYGMIYGYKNGKFDNITSKINGFIGKTYNKAFKKELSKPILSPKGFTIITTILIFLVIASFGSSEEGIDTEVTSNEVVSGQSNIGETNTDGNGSNQEDLEKENIIETTDAEIHFINTGNSDAILIKQGDKSALIDGGDNDDEGKVVSYLQQQGVNELEYVFATHPHADHIGGLDAVVDAITIKNIYVSNGDSDTKTYSDFINSMANKGLNPSVPLLNSEFNLGTSKFKVLSVANTGDPNNNSLVLLYMNGSDKVLLMGDAESEIEDRINTEDVDLLKIGHHGSNSSSSSNFINKANPEYAIITVGENNKYGHPHKETMETLESRNIEVHRTDECGNIVFKSTGEGLITECDEGSYASGINSKNSGNSITSTSGNGNYSSGSSNSSNEGSSTSDSSNGNVIIVPTPEPEPEPEPTPEPTVSESTVYANGGSSKSNKYHSSPTAHNMEGAIPMSESEAQSKGYVACKRCY